MILDIAIEDDRWQQSGLATLAQNAARATFAHLGLAGQGIGFSLLGCDDARIASLNHDFRDKAQATNVLSWPANDLAAEVEGATPFAPEKDPLDFGDGDAEIELGDIAIAYDTCAREAAEQGKTLTDHSTHLIIHGVLHLLGYDHIRDKDATLMESHERAILGKLGLSDPYIERE